MTQAQASSEALPLSQARLQVFASLNDLFFTSSRSIFIIFEAVIVFVFFCLAWWLSPWGTLDEHLPILAGFYSIVFVGLSLGVGQYERFRRFSYTKILVNGLIAAFVSFVTSVTAAYLWYHGMFGRLTVGWGATGSLLVITATRFLTAYLFSFHPYKFAIFGSSSHLQEVLSLLSSKTFRASRYFSYYAMDENMDWQRMREQLDASPVYDLVVTDTFRLRPDFQKMVLDLIRRGIRIIDEHTFYEDIFEKVVLDRFSVQTLLSREFTTRRIFSDTAKRLIDVSVSLVGLLVLSPLLLLIAGIIKMSSQGPIFFIQPRQGRLGQSFRMFKFRTMTQELSCQDASGGFTRQNDARVTHIGKLLRPLHLDELPQLLNILFGHMSIVGPRPEALSFAARMSAAIPQYDLRYIMRPGLTGHAQLMVGYMMDTVEDTKQKLAYDLYYIINYSLAMDIRIIMRTAFVVLKKIF